MRLEAKVIYPRQLKKDLNEVSVTGDYQVGGLSDVMQKPLYIQSVVDCIEKYARGFKKIAVFGVNIEHCEKIYEALKASGEKCCQESFKNYQNRMTRKLYNLICLITVHELSYQSQKLTEGWDYPPTDCVIFARPTLSGNLYVQIIGRMLRISPCKDKCLLIDLTPNVELFGIDIGQYRTEN